jgi:hypothetical protein
LAFARLEGPFHCAFAYLRRLGFRMVAGTLPIATKVLSGRPMRLVPDAV